MHWRGVIIVLGALCSVLTAPFGVRYGFERAHATGFLATSLALRGHGATYLAHDPKLLQELLKQNPDAVRLVVIPPKREDNNSFVIFGITTAVALGGVLVWQSASRARKLKEHIVANEKQPIQTSLPMRGRESAIHFICTKGCWSVSGIPGTCPTKQCLGHGKALERCECKDGKHNGRQDVYSRELRTFHPQRPQWRRKK